MIADNLTANGHGSVALADSNNEAAWPTAGSAFWTAAASQATVEAYSRSEAPAGWKAWRKYLRKRPRIIAQFGNRKLNALGWGLGPVADDTRLGQLLALLTKESGGKNGSAAVADLAEQWLNEPAGDGAPPDLAPNEALAWSHLLAARPELFTGPLWWRLLEALCQLAAAPAPAIEDDAVARQIYRGELPLTLAWLFPEVAPCEALHPAAVETLSLGVAEILDGEGLPQRRFLPQFRRLITCWTRCRLIGEAIGQPAGDGDVLHGGCWKAEAEEQFPFAVREALRLSRAAGKPVLTDDDTETSRHWRRERHWLTDVALPLVKNKANRRLATMLVNNGKPWSATKTAELPPPAVHSEWAEIGVLRTDWSRRAAQLTCAYGEQRMQVELEVAGELFFSGAWDFEVRLDGEVAKPASQWREICWVSDAGCDYLEMELELSHSLTVQRQIMLARNDQALFLADAVLGERPGAIEYRSHLPLSPRVVPRPAAGTWELFLEAGKRRALVLPLALPEWRSATRDGSLSVESGRLELRQSWHGARLYAPLWIDLSRRRQTKPFTWRPLTVAEQRVNQPRDVAAGYRIQFAKRQWLVYRSLKRPGNRTVLGQNLATDFLLARFGRDGETQALVEVE